MNIFLSNPKFILILLFIINIVSGDVAVCRSYLNRLCSGLMSTNPQECFYHIFEVIVQEENMIDNYSSWYKQYLASQVILVNVELKKINNYVYEVEVESFLKPTLFCRTFYGNGKKNVSVRTSDGKLIARDKISPESTIDHVIEINYDAPGNLYYPFPSVFTSVLERVLLCRDNLEKYNVIDGMTHVEILFRFYNDNEIDGPRKNSIGDHYKKHVIYASKLKPMTKDTSQFCNEPQCLQPFKIRNYNEIVQYDSVHPDSSVTLDEVVEKWKNNLYLIFGRKLCTPLECFKVIFNSTLKYTVDKDEYFIPYVKYLVENIDNDIMLKPILFCRSINSPYCSRPHVHKSNGRIVCSTKTNYNEYNAMSSQTEVNDNYYDMHDLKFVEIDYKSPNDLYYGIFGSNAKLSSKLESCYDELMSLENFSADMTEQQIILYFLTYSLDRFNSYHSYVRKYRNHVMLTSMCKLRPGTFGVLLYSLSKSPKNCNKRRLFVRNGAPVGYDAPIGHDDPLENNAPVGNDIPIGNNAPVGYSGQVEYVAPVQNDAQVDYNNALNIYNNSSVYDATMNYGDLGVDDIQEVIVAPVPYDTLVGNNALVGNNTLSGYNHLPGYVATHDNQAGFVDPNIYSVGYTDGNFTQSGNDGQGGSIVPEGYGDLFTTTVDRDFIPSGNYGQSGLHVPEGYGDLFTTDAVDRYFTPSASDVQSGLHVPEGYGDLFTTDAVGRYFTPSGSDVQSGLHVPEGYGDLFTTNVVDRDFTPSASDIQSGLHVPEGYGNFFTTDVLGRHFTPSGSDVQSGLNAPEVYGDLFRTDAAVGNNNGGRYNIQSEHIAPTNFDAVDGNNVSGLSGPSVGYTAQVGGDVQDRYIYPSRNITPGGYSASVGFGTSSEYNVPPYNNGSSSSGTFNIENNSTNYFSRGFY